MMPFATSFILDLQPRRFAGMCSGSWRNWCAGFRPTPWCLFRGRSPTVWMICALPGRAIFLTTQEALANVARHAAPRRLTSSPSTARLIGNPSIRDNGRGFDSSNESLRLGMVSPTCKCQRKGCMALLIFVPRPGWAQSLS